MSAGYTSSSDGHTYTYRFCDACTDLTSTCPYGVQSSADCDFGARLKPPLAADYVNYVAEAARRQARDQPPGRLVQEQLATPLNTLR